MSKALTAEQIKAHLNRLAIMRDVKVNKGINHTIPQVLRKIIHCKKKCEDCNRTVKNRVVEAHVVFYPVRHWLQQCNKCHAFLCRRTGKYQDNWHTAHNHTLTDIGYHRSEIKRALNCNQNLTTEQLKDLKLYRNQLQGVRFKDKFKSKIKDK